MMLRSLYCLIIHATQCGTLNVRSRILGLAGFYSLVGPGARAGEVSTGPQVGWSICCQLGTSDLGIGMWDSEIQEASQSTGIPQ